MKKLIAMALTTTALAVGIAAPASAAETTVAYRTATASGSSTSRPLTLEALWIRNSATSTPYSQPTYDVFHISSFGTLYDGTFMTSVSAKYTQGRSYWYVSPTVDRMRLKRTSNGTFTAVDVTFMNPQRTKQRVVRVLLPTWLA